MTLIYGTLGATILFALAAMLGQSLANQVAEGGPEEVDGRAWDLAYAALFLRCAATFTGVVTVILSIAKLAGVL